MCINNHNDIPSIISASTNTGLEGKLQNVGYQKSVPTFR